MVLDLKNNKKNNNYAMAQANVYRIYFLYLLKGAFLELLCKLCNAFCCPAHEVKLNLSWENICVMYLNNNAKRAKENIGILDLAGFKGWSFR